MSDGETSNLVFITALITIPVVGSEMITNGSLFKRSRHRGREMPMLFLSGIAASFIFAFSGGAASVVGGETLTFKNYLLTYIPAAFALAAFEIYKAASLFKKNKNKEESK